MKDMVLVSFVVDLLLCLLLLFLFFLQRRDRHALFWGLGHLSLSFMVFFWYLPVPDLPLPQLRYEMMTLLAVIGWCGYWFGGRWVTCYQLPNWRRDLAVFVVLAFVLRWTVSFGDPFESARFDYRPDALSGDDGDFCRQWLLALDFVTGIPFFSCYFLVTHCDDVGNTFCGGISMASKRSDGCHFRCQNQLFVRFYLFAVDAVAIQISRHYRKFKSRIFCAG